MSLGGIAVTPPCQLHLGIREGRRPAHVRPRVGGNSDGNEVG
jgi:hypothetical protein